MVFSQYPVVMTFVILVWLSPIYFLAFQLLTTIKQRRYRRAAFYLFFAVVTTSAVFGLSRLIDTGYFVRWEQLPAPPIQTTHVFVTNYGLTVQDAHTSFYLSRGVFTDKEYQPDKYVWKSFAPSHQKPLAMVQSCNEVPKAFTPLTNFPRNLAVCETIHTDIAYGASSDEIRAVDKNNTFYVWRYYSAYPEGNEDAILLELCPHWISIPLLALFDITATKILRKKESASG